MRAATVYPCPSNFGYQNEHRFQQLQMSNNLSIFSQRLGKTAVLLQFYHLKVKASLLIAHFKGLSIYSAHKRIKFSFTYLVRYIFTQ